MNEFADRPLWRPLLWPLVFIFAGMALLQISLAGRQSLWTDEIFSVALATGHSLEHSALAADPTRGDFVEPDTPRSAAEFRRYLKHEDPPAPPTRVLRAVLLSDTSPPLYYLLLYGWTILFGTSDFAVRLFSVMWWLASFPLLAGVARLTGGRRAILPACILFALSPLGLYFSAEVRMYSLLVFCSLATVSTSLALHERGNRVALYVLWILASVAGFLTHYFFAFPWVATVAFLVLRPGRFQRRWLIACICLMAVALLPWYAMASQSVNSWRVTQGWLMLEPSGFQRLRSIRNHFLQFFSCQGFGLWKLSRKPGLAALTLFAVTGAVMAWRLRFEMFKGNRLILWFWFLVACAGPSALDLLQHSYIANQPRYVLAALPAAYLLAALGLTCMAARLRVILLLLIGLAWTVPIVNIYRQNWRGRQPFRQIAHTITGTGSSSDLILIHSIPAGVLGMARYSLNPDAQITSWVQQLGNRRLPESLPRLVEGWPAVLYVRVDQGLREPLPEKEWLNANGIASQEKHFESVTTIEFRPTSAASF